MVDKEIDLDQIPFRREAFATYTTEVLMRLLYECDTDEYVMDDCEHYAALAEELLGRTNLALNCAYIDLFESKLYSKVSWNVFFNRWCRKRLNLQQHNLIYGDDGNSIHTRSEMFHDRKNGKAK